MKELIFENWDIIATALLAISEVLALIPGVKSNSIFQILTGWMKAKK